MDSHLNSPKPRPSKQSPTDVFNEALTALFRRASSSEKQPQWCAPLQSAPTAPTLPKKRGSAGGKAANWGEPYLMQIVMDLFAKEKNPKQCKDISHLWCEHKDLLADAWMQYQDELEHKKRYHNKVLTYGHSLKADGMERKLRKWVKDPDFRKHLVDLGYLEE